jgi:hypothetical protein
VRRALPGVLFGPTALPRGQGHSVEFVVDAARALAAVETLLRAVESEFDLGRQLLGAMSVRFVGASTATETEPDRLLAGRESGGLARRPPEVASLGQGPSHLRKPHSQRRRAR